MTTSQVADPVVGVRAVVVLVALEGRAEMPAAVELVQSMPGVALVEWARLEREGRAVAIAARVRARVSVEELRANARTWSKGRGWGVTVAAL